MFELIKPGTQIDFVGKRHIWIILSIISILGSIALLATRGLNYGIDFTGGAELHLKVPGSWDTGQVRGVLESTGIHESKVLQIGEKTSGEFLLRIQGDQSMLNQISEQVSKAFAGKLAAGEFEMKGVSVVGPAAGGNLRKSGFLAMFYALLVILIYVAVRFDARYAPGAVLALFHDTMLTLGLFSITGMSFDLTILAALLALIGYSNNDTIIVFDRIRETTALNPNLKIEDLVNRSINETLGRTILTSLLTFFTAAALYFFGGAVIQGFAFTFMVGIVVGSYSSIFIAGSIVIYLTRFMQTRAKKAAQA